VALVFVLGLHTLLTRQSEAYRKSKGSPKYVFLSAIVTAASVIHAENTHLAHMAQVNDADAARMDAYDRAVLARQQAQAAASARAQASGAAIAAAPVVAGGKAQQLR
jgi:hypothetical protein